MVTVTAISHGTVSWLAAVRPVMMTPVVTSVISAVSPVRQAAAIERTEESESFTSVSNAALSAALTGLGWGAGAGGTGGAPAIRSRAVR